MNFSESIFKGKKRAKTALSCFKKRAARKSKIHCENGGVIVVSTQTAVNKKTRHQLDQIFSARAKSIQDILLLSGSGRYFCEFLDLAGDTLRCRLKIEFKHVLYEGEGMGKSALEAAASALELLTRNRNRRPLTTPLELEELMAS